MKRCFLLMLLALASGCGAHREGVGAAPARQADADGDRRLANLERAARYPWKDDGRCAVREASADWATLVERCFDALDRSKIRFVDHKHVCPVAQAGAISADEMVRLVGICLLVQPELAVGAMVVISAFAVAMAISAEIDAARAKKPGCACKCFKQNDGVYSIGRYPSPAACAQACRDDDRHFTGSICK